MCANVGWSVQDGAGKSPGNGPKIENLRSTFEVETRWDRGRGEKDRVH